MDFGQLSSGRGLQAALAEKSALLWAGLFLALACMVCAAVPPLRSPDEIDHVRRAYLLSRGEWVLSRGATEIQGVAVIASGGAVDTGLDTFLMVHFAQIIRPDKPGVDDGSTRAKDIGWTGETAFRPAPGTAYYFPLLYGPQAAALALGEHWHLSVADSYSLARFFAILCSASLLWLAFALYPVNLGVLALLSLPMALFQMASASLDGPANALAVLLISVFLRILPNASTVSKYWFGLWCLGLWVLVTCRPHLLPMMALPFLVSVQTRNKGQAVLGALTLVAAIAWFWIAVHATADPRAQLGQSTSELMRSYLMHPDAFIAVLWRTVADGNNMEFYWKSFIGILGWLDTPLPIWAYLSISCCGVVLWLGGNGVRSGEFRIAERWGLWAVAFASTLLVFFALLITWTPHPAQVIKGIQGRYFFVPALMLAYATHPPMHLIRGWRQGLQLPALLCFITLNGYVLIITMLHRYPLTLAADLLTGRF